MNKFNAYFSDQGPQVSSKEDLYNSDAENMSVRSEYV